MDVSWTNDPTALVVQQRVARELKCRPRPRHHLLLVPRAGAAKDELEVLVGRGEHLHGGWPAVGGSRTRTREQSDTGRETAGQHRVAIKPHVSRGMSTKNLKEMRMMRALMRWTRR